MRLTDLVHDPFEQFDDDDKPTEAEREGRAAVRQGLQGFPYDRAPGARPATKT